MNWSNIENDQVKPVCLFELSSDEGLQEAFKRINTQPIIKQIHQREGTNEIYMFFQITDYVS